MNIVTGGSSDLRRDTSYQTPEQIAAHGDPPGFPGVFGPQDMGDPG